MARESGSPSRATERAMAILNYMAAVRSPVGISEVARSLSFPKSSVFAIMHTLVRGRYAEIDDGERKTYRLGFRLFQTGITYLSNVDFHRVAHPLLHELMNRLEESIHLAVEDDKHLVFVDSIEAKHLLLRSVARLGRSESPMYCSGLGKALLAAWSDQALVDEYRGAPFVPVTPNTVRNFAELLEEVTRTRHRGYAIDAMESNADLFCVACPLYDRDGRVVAAMSCTAPAAKMDEQLSVITDAVLETAMRISQRLGFLGSRFYAEFA